MEKVVWQLTFEFLKSPIMLIIPIGIILKYEIQRTKVALFIVFFLSFCIELLQLILSIGVFEISDLIGNTFGGVIGIAICQTLKHLWVFLSR